MKNDLKKDFLEELAAVFLKLVQNSKVKDVVRKNLIVIRNIIQQHSQGKDIVYDDIRNELF